MEHVSDGDDMTSDLRWAGPHQQAMESPPPDRCLLLLCSRCAVFQPLQVLLHCLRVRVGRAPPRGRGLGGGGAWNRPRGLLRGGAAGRGWGEGARGWLRGWRLRPLGHLFP